MRPAATLLRVLSMAACASPPPAVEAPSAPNAAPPNDTYGSSMHGERIGTPIDGPGVRGESRLNRPIRPGAQVTMDDLAQRVVVRQTARTPKQAGGPLMNCGALLLRDSRV
jgi:hypothetical protein